MKKLSIAAMSLVMILSACSGNPLEEVVDPNNPTDPTTPTDPDSPPIASDRVLPPGTNSPSRATAIVRHEEEDVDTGNGYANGFAYNRTTDTFSVNGLAFDGDNEYRRGTLVSAMGPTINGVGPFSVYEGPATSIDPLTGATVPQFEHRAIYGVSPSGRTEFAIVRTGAYISYGFGGFIYQRNDNVTLPTSGSASYNGPYAAIRDFNGNSGLEYSRGDMNMSIDFNDFDQGDGVSGTVYNRVVFDSQGNDVTDDIIAAFSDDPTARPSELPIIRFSVGPRVLDANGELTGKVTSNYRNPDGSLSPYENGDYYAVISGAGTEQEVVGIIVTEATDPRFKGVTSRETGGFILKRAP